MALRVLVSRTDNIGDVVLTLPLCGLLKARFGAHVTFLGRAYTRPVVEASDAVDAAVTWDAALAPAARRAVVAAARADVVLHVYPRLAVARAAWAAGVPRRIGTSRRVYHWLYCNVLEPVARRRSPLHEAQLNVRLARSLLGADALAPAELAAFGRLRPQTPLPPALAALAAPDRFTLVLHPRSSGSAREWPLERYRALVDALPADRYRVLVTGTGEEGAGMRAWLAALPQHAHDVTGRTSLPELIALLGAADGVVAGSTGPLHLGAALGTRALGLYPPTPPMHAGRWGPIGLRASALVAPAPCVACEAGHGDVRACACLDAISPDAVVARVNAWAAEREHGAPPSRAVGPR